MLKPKKKKSRSQEISIQTLKTLCPILIWGDSFPTLSNSPMPTGCPAVNSVLMILTQVKGLVRLIQR